MQSDAVVKYAKDYSLEKWRNGLFTLDEESGAVHYANTLSGRGKSPQAFFSSLPHRYAVLYFSFSLEKSNSVIA